MSFDKLRPPGPTPAPRRSEPLEANRRAAPVDLSMLAQQPEPVVAESQGTIAGAPKATFLTDLRRAVVAAAGEELAGSGWTAEGCPWIEYWLAYYATQTPDHIEAAMHRFAPGTQQAATVEEYLAPTIARVRAAIRTWRQTGTIEAPFDRADPSALGPDAIRAELGESRPLDSHVRTRMEQGLGQALPAVQVHTGAPAAAFSREHDARAVAIGGSIGFASSQYRPGTTTGDLLIAHELAHVVQQSAATGRSFATDAHAEEGQADTAAVAAVARLKGRSDKRPLLSPARGLSLRRCVPDNPFDDSHAFDDVRNGETKQQAWLRHFRNQYPQLENIDYDKKHSRDPGIDTESGVRVPQDPKNFLTPRFAYEHLDAAFLAYQGDIHLAELVEARHPTAFTLTANARGRTITDKELDLRAYVKWSGRAKASAEGVQVGLMFADVVMLGSAVAADARLAAAERAAAREEAAAARGAAREGEAVAKPIEEPTTPPAMHDGKETIAEAETTIGGEKHEVVATKEPSGPPRARMCSVSCDIAVKNLEKARDNLPANADPSARAMLDDLIAEGKTIDADLAKGADRAGRQQWKPRLDNYADKLTAAAKKYPNEIGEPLKAILNGEPLKLPGDEGYTSGTKPNSWRLTDDGMGAHLFERANVKGRPKLAKFDQPGTPRYYPYGTPENAGQAHLRIHDASAGAGVKLGGSPMSDEALLDAYKKAYAEKGLDGIKGDLKIPGGPTLATRVTPREAFEALLKWAGL